MYYNEAIYKELRDNGIEPYPSKECPFDVEGAYPPNSHECMPRELINDHLKENSRNAFLDPKTKKESPKYEILANTSGEGGKESWQRDYARPHQIENHRAKYKRANEVLSFGFTLYIFETLLTAQFLSRQPFGTFGMRSKPNISIITRLR